VADNTTLNAGSGGDTIASDDIAGVKHQRVKVQFGADGSATDVSAGAPLPVDGSGVTQPISAASLPLPTGAATAANQLPNSHDVTVDNAAGAAAVNIQDGGNSITVDAVSLPLPTGAATAAAQLPDGHNVTVDNGAGGAAVNVQDGGNALTVDNGGTFAVQDSEKVVDNSGFTDGTTKVQPAGYIYDEVAGTALTENDAVAARVDVKRAQICTIEDETTRGRRATVTAGLALKVDGSAVTQPVSGTVSVTEPVSVDDNAGSLTVDAPIGTPVNVQVGNATLAAGVVDETGASAVDALAVGGGTPHDSVDSGDPLKLGAKAVSSLESQTMVAANDRTNLHADLDGVLVVKQWAPGADIINERVSNTDGASTAFTTFGAGGTGVRNYVTTIVVHNAHASTNGYVDIRDGTAGAVLMTIPLPANGGAVISLPVPLRQPTANTALAYDVSAAITTIYISLVGFQSKA
jgi:hypothetical protein